MVEVTCGGWGRGEMGIGGWSEGDGSERWRGYRRGVKGRGGGVKGIRGGVKGYEGEAAGAVLLGPRMGKLINFRIDRIGRRPRLS